MKIEPEFDKTLLGLDELPPEVAHQHLEELTKKEKPIIHAQILEKLIEKLELVDFQTLVYPQVVKMRERLKEDIDPEEAKDIRKILAKLKVQYKHYVIITVEQILRATKQNDWGMCKHHEFIYVYNSNYWVNIDKELFQKFLGQAAQKMGVNKFDANYFKFKETLFKQFLSAAYLPKPDPPINKVMINLLNGTFDITPQKVQLRSFVREDFLTYQLPFNYDPDAKAPLFQKYLTKVLPDESSQRVLSEFVGYVFIRGGAVKEEKALILYGTGANGKSVFFEVVNALLGPENTCNYSLKSLTDEKGYHRANLANKLVNYASEINTKLEANLFKQLISGEPVEARVPYCPPFILKDYARFIFNCNQLPRDVEHTNAYFRRFLIVPFDVTIPPSEQDKELHTKIINKELAGVFNWVLEGLQRLLKQKGFTECTAVEKAVEAYKLESDSVKLFVKENEYQKSAVAYISLKDLYIAYRIFCSDDGFKAVSKINFRKRLEGTGILIERKSVGNVVFLSKDDD